MKENAVYNAYLDFLQQYFPDSAFLKFSEGDIKGIFNTINQTSVYIDAVHNSNALTEEKKKLLIDLRVMLVKVLYTLPSNDEFQYNAIMRAVVENILRLFLSTTDNFTYSSLKKIGFSSAQKSLKDSALYSSYKSDIDITFSYFGKFSKDIHSLGFNTNTILYLVHMRTTKYENNLNNKISIFSKIQNIILYSLTPALEIKSESLDSGNLVKIHTMLGDRKYQKLTI